MALKHPWVDQTLAVSLLVVDGWYFWGMYTRHFNMQEHVEFRNYVWKDLLTFAGTHYSISIHQFKLSGAKYHCQFLA